MKIAEKIVKKTKKKRNQQHVFLYKNTQKLLLNIVIFYQLLKYTLH